MGNDEDGRHAEGLRHFEIARQVLEHHRRGGIDAVLAEEAGIGVRMRLRKEVGPDDVEDVVERLVETDPRQDPLRMAERAVGQDEASAGQPLDCGDEFRIRVERRMVDVVHEVEEGVGRYAVLDDQPAQRGAVATVIVAPDLDRLFGRDRQELLQIELDAVADLPEQAGVARIERVVEVEHPGADVGEPGERRIRRHWASAHFRLSA